MLQSYKDSSGLLLTLVDSNPVNFSAVFCTMQFFF